MRRTDHPPGLYGLYLLCKALVSSMVADFNVDDLLGTELTTWSNATGAELPVVELRGLQKLWA